MDDSNSNDRIFCSATPWHAGHGSTEHYIFSCDDRLMDGKAIPVYEEG